jgi:hypothetical protein
MRIFTPEFLKALVEDLIILAIVFWIYGMLAHMNLFQFFWQFVLIFIGVHVVVEYIMGRFYL